MRVASFVAAAALLNLATAYVFLAVLSAVSED